MNFWDEPPALTYDQIEQLEDLARAVRAADETRDYATLQVAALELAEAVFPAEIQAEYDATEATAEADAAARLDPFRGIPNADDQHPEDIRE